MQKGSLIWITNIGSKISRYQVEITHIDEHHIVGFYRVEFKGELDDWVERESLRVIGAFPFKSAEKIELVA